ncbi:tetratricopeptide repeat protein [Candidatus Nitrosacidococcus tergens]|uniref:tetratricopeptide repeat protein n=1 Tax=Candidatus Nitrosacidococcus tergens TaxID=553981 RepID=UPI0018D72024|nr:tetratricopeptide repeat protein [Candidatus Nitrosacidococcus tergens]
MSILSNSAIAAAQYSLSPRTYESLSAIHKLLNKEEYNTALSKLKDLFSLVQGAGQQKNYEQAIVLQTLGYTYSSLENYPKAIQTFKDSLNLKVLPDQVSNSVHYALGQLYIITERYAEAAAFLEDWLRDESIGDSSTDAHVLAANAYYHLKKYTKTISHITAAINHSEDPKEYWYQLSLAARLELKQYPESAKILEILITKFPEKKEYWQQLAGIYLELNQEQRSLAVQGLTTHIKSFKEVDLVRLSDFYRYLNMPYKAGIVLQKGFTNNTIKTSDKNLERLAESWFAAKEWEKAANAFKQAGKLREDGKMELRLGQMFIELQQWKQAELAFKQALKKGGLKDSGQVYISLARVEYEQEQIVPAIEFLKKAKRSPKYHNQADQWLKHLQLVQQQHTEAETEG